MIAMMSAGGLFHFRKDSDEYIIKPDDYPLKPLRVYAPHTNNSGNGAASAAPATPARDLAPAISDD
jgi:hypothetical protein